MTEIISENLSVRGTPSFEEPLLTQFQHVRQHTLKLVARLETEDFVMQTAPEVSPPKWHLAHTTWFFEEFILKKYSDYQPFSDLFQQLFNSYYKGVGPHWPQAGRGLLSRPTVDEILDYRDHVDTALYKHVDSSRLSPELRFLMRAGIEHEKQHQELLLMDIKHILAANPAPPVYFAADLPPAQEVHRLGFYDFTEGLCEVGACAGGFVYDNERPRHRIFQNAFAIANRLITNQEFLEFIEDRGYIRPELWLSKGWDWVEAERIRSPLYWALEEGVWREFTLHGSHPLRLDFPVVHLSYFEADAFARWSGYRLPTEAEYEIFLHRFGGEGTHDRHTGFATGCYHPTRATAVSGQVWAWTQSHYSPYPGFKNFPGLLGEYNGKFMCGQFVLRGGSAITPSDHFRKTYRNFFEPQQRWMFSGLRLAKDLE